MMDRLPKRKELVFMRARKTLYLQLTTVIRSLGTKFRNTTDREQVWRLLDHLMPSFDRPLYAWNQKVVIYGRIFCILREISDVAYVHRAFLLNGKGDGNSTKKLKAGIKRLEFLRDNWDDLEITGGLKNGYRLAIRKTH